MVSPVFIRPALVIIVTATVICIVIAIFRNGFNHTAPVPSAFPQLPQNIDIALKQARFSEMKDGTVVWELAAERVEYDKNGEVAHLTGGIRMDVAGSGTRGNILVTSDSGEYQVNNKNIRLRGKVAVLTGDGASFATDSIDYSAAATKIKTADPVLFRQERLTLHATGMELDVTEQKARFFKSVDATVDGVSQVTSRTGQRSEADMKSAARSTSKSAGLTAKKKVVKKGKKRRRSKKS